jgi:hypothetical protein
MTDAYRGFWAVAAAPLVPPSSPSVVPVGTVGGRGTFRNARAGDRRGAGRFGLRDPTEGEPCTS